MKILYCLILLWAPPLWGQDSIVVKYQSEFHLEHDSRNYDNEAEEGVVFMYNRFISNLPDGNYFFIDSVSNTVRLKGSVRNFCLTGKWFYFDSLGRKRIEDIFFDDADSTVITNYYNEEGFLYRSKEGSNKLLRTVHYGKAGMTDYFYKNFSNNSGVNESFDSLGNVLYRTEFKNGLEHGEHFWTYDDGSLYSQRFYDLGKKVGVWKSNLREQKGIWCTETFENDKLISISFKDGKTYNIDSTKIEIIDCYPRGKVRLKGFVENGYKIGTWKFYNEDGEVIGEFAHDEKGNLTSLTLKSNDIPGI